MTPKLIIASSFALAYAAAGCATHDISQGSLAAGSDDQNQAGYEDDQNQAGYEYDRDDCKIENGDLGVIELKLALGSKTVTFTSWSPKADEPGSYVGFTLSIAGAQSVKYIVKAGGERHAGDGTRWEHPNGNEGPAVPAISHIDFCAECEYDGCEPEPSCDEAGACDTGPTDEPDPCLDSAGCDAGPGPIID
jgi:hypothetical protein